MKLLLNDLRTVAGLALTFASLIALLMLASCAPKPVERVYPVAKTDFGPLQKDPTIQFDKVHGQAIDASKLNWNETLSASRVFRFGEAMMSLGELKSSPALVKLGQRVGAAFYAGKDTATKMPFVEATYINAAIGETKADVMPIIEKNDKMLAAQLPIIRGILKKSAATFPWPSPETEPKAALALAKVYVKGFLEKASRSDLEPEVYKAIEGAFTTDLFPLIEGLSKEIDSVLDEKDSVVIIDRLKTLATKFDVDFGDETNKMLVQARSVFQQIGEIDTNQDALTVIVLLWEMTAPESREKTFKPVSEELYDFLRNKGPKDLRCIKSPKCLNPLILIPKMIGLKPAIQKYGLAKLKVDIEGAAHDSLVKEISAAIADFVPQIPAQIDSKVTEQLGVIQKKLASVRQDYAGFIRGIANEFAKQNLKQSDESPARLVGLETRRVKLALSKGSITVAPALEQAETGSEVIGDSMSYAAALWQTADPTSLTYQKSVISQIDKLLAIGGYQTASKKPYPSLAISLDPTKPAAHFSVRDDLTGDVPFAVPDAFPVASDLTPTFKSEGKTISVRGQAELLRGLAKMVRYFRDWESNGFDTSLGSVQVGKLIKDLPAGAVDARLFPKDSFFALSVANGANILVNMTKKLSPVFLIDISKKATWANERSDDSDQPATMAGVVDIIGGQRSNIVHVGDAARLLLAISDFIDATDGIEKTKASPLITPNAEGKKPLDALAEARAQLSLILVGIGNFISHEMQATDGGIRTSFHQDLVTVNAKEPRRAADQALAILALLRAGEALHKEIYDWPAMDAYAFMNRSLFNTSTGFYNVEEGRTELPPPDEIALIILAGEQLKSHMSVASKAQWDKLSSPWVRALEQLN